LRQPISSAEIRRYINKELSVPEILEFDERLQAAGIAPDVPKPALDLLQAVRPDLSSELFDEETLLEYVQGRLESGRVAAIDRFRKIDPDLDADLLTMEGTRRQIDASLQLAGQQPAETRARKRGNWNFSFALAAAGACLILTAVVLLVPSPHSGFALVSRGTIPFDALSVAGFGVSTKFSPLAQSSLTGAPVTIDPAVRPQLVALASPTKDVAKLTPAACLVLPAGVTRLTWQGIHAASVTCSLMNADGVVLAKADVTKGNSWLYRKPLPTGEYKWTAAWRAKNGKTKTATRQFRVVGLEAANAVMLKLSRYSDPVSRSVVLAQNGYTYQSLQMLDSMVATKPTVPGLTKLRDSIAKIAAI
jgi:hypothetical protein